jgi:hypothetical protein
MLDNNTFNLMMQLIEEKRSLSRIKNKNIKQPSNNKECRNFLKKLEKNKEEHMKDLEEHLGKTSILNLEIQPPKKIRALLTNQGYPQKGIKELSKLYNIPIK